jgi:hypothetical protein
MEVGSWFSSPTTRRGMGSVEKRYRDDLLTPSFASDLEDLMGVWRP